MKAYKYRQDTKEYAGEIDQFLVPKSEPPKYIVPPNSTAIRPAQIPPFPQNNAVVYVDEKIGWKMVPDFRTSTFFNLKNEMVHLKLGEAPTKDLKPNIPFTDQELASRGVLTRDQILKTKYDLIDATTQKLIYAGFWFENSTFSCSVPAQLNWTGMKTFYDTNILKLPTQIPTIDNKYFTLTQANASAFFLGMFRFIRECVDSGMAKKGEVDKITNLNVLLAWEDDRTQTGMETNQTGE